MRRASIQDITYLARTNHRSSAVPFGIRRADRRSHVYICGKTGTGKSHLLRLVLEQDIANGEGCCLVDPHGDLALDVRSAVPDDRQGDLVYFNAADIAGTWRFNPFANVPPLRRAMAAAAVVETFKRLWPDEWGPRLEHILRNVAYTLLETDGATFGDIPALLTDRTYRSQITAALENDVVRDFWTNEFDKYAPGFRSVATAPLHNKVGAMLTDPNLRRVLCEPGEFIDLREIMDSRRILIVNLDKGRLGEGPSALLGSLLLSHIAFQALSRSEHPVAERRDFWVVVDEFQTFTTLSIASMLAELRKYGVGLLLAHQHLSQLDPAIRDAVFGNAGTIVTFRVGAADASYLARELAPFTTQDLTGLPRYQAYIRLLIDGQPARPFSVTTFGSCDEIPGWADRSPGTA